MSKIIKTMSKNYSINTDSNKYVSSVLKQTKANIRWMKVHHTKVNILLDNGLNMDEIKVVARYIGSCSHDKKTVCKFCGEIYSKKKSQMDKVYHYKCSKDPKVIQRKKEDIEEYKKYLLERKQDILDKEMIKMIDMIEEDKNEVYKWLGDLIKNVIKIVIGN